MATTNKTRPTGQDVQEYLSTVTPTKRREDGTLLADLFREASGEEPVMWGPSIIGYGSYLSISSSSATPRGRWPKTGFSPRKARLSLYGLKDLPEGAALLPSLGTFTEGAGCIYVKKLEDIDLDVLRRMITIASSRTGDPGPR